MKQGAHGAHGAHGVLRPTLPPPPAKSATAGQRNAQLPGSCQPGTIAPAFPVQEARLKAKINPTLTALGSLTLPWSPNNYKL